MRMQSCQCILHHPNPNPSSVGLNLLSSMSYPYIFGHLIGALIGIVGANVQGQTESLLETHSTNIWSFIIATAVYCYAYSADVKSRLHRENSSQFWCLAAIALGSVSAVSLVSTIVPHPDIGRIILYTTWIGAVVISVVYHYGTLFMEASLKLYQKTLKPFCVDTCNRFQAYTASSIGQPRPTLPV